MEELILEITILVVIAVALVLRYIAEGNKGWKFLLTGALLYLTGYALKYSAIGWFEIVKALSTPIKAIGDIAVIIGSIYTIITLFKEYR